MQKSKLPEKKLKKFFVVVKKGSPRPSCFKGFFMPTPKEVVVTSFTGNLEH